MSMHPSTQTPSQRLAAIIREVRDEYIEQYGFKSYFEINCGDCYNFADTVSDRSRGLLADVMEEGNYQIWDEQDNPIGWNWDLLTAPQGLTEKEMDVITLNHGFLQLGDRFHDSECPDGVDSIFDLPCFKRHIVMALRSKGIPADDVVTDDILPSPPCPVPNPTAKERGARRSSDRGMSF